MPCSTGDVDNIKMMFEERGKGTMTSAVIACKLSANVNRAPEKQ
jgi:hypothetical protein